MKNATTKSLDDPVLEAMPVVPTDRMDSDRPQSTSGTSIQNLITEALQTRPELAESDVDLVNRQISRRAARNALLPSLSLVGFYSGAGLAGPLNSICSQDCTVNVPGDFGGALNNAFNNSSPDYYVGLNLNIPLRNRVAKADQYRSELEYRQAELRMEQLKKQVRIEVRNAQYAVEQTGARVQAARKARDLAQRTFDITKKEQDLGAGSSYQTLSAQRDLSLAALDLVTAMTIFEKAKVELDRATGATLEHNGIELQNAVNGTVSDTRARSPLIDSHADSFQTGRDLGCCPGEGQLRSPSHPRGRRPAACSRSARTPFTPPRVRSGDREIAGSCSRRPCHRVVRCTAH